MLHAGGAPAFFVAARGLAQRPLNGVPAARLRAGHARPLRSTRGSDLPLPGVFSGATGGHGAVKTAPYKPPAIAASRGRLFPFGIFFIFFALLEHFSIVLHKLVAFAVPIIL